MSEDESQRIDPYEIVIADLRSQRERIDNAIAAIETVRAVASPAATASPPPGPAQPSKSSEVGPGDLLGMSIADATKKLLAIKRTTLKNPEIVTLFKAGGLILNSKDWTNTIGAVLTRRSVEVGDIVKVDRGTWGLKEWYPGRSFARKDAGKPEGGEKPAAEDEAPEGRPEFADEVTI